jgi:hypothetical protein
VRDLPGAQTGRIPVRERVEESLEVLRRPVTPSLRISSATEKMATKKLKWKPDLIPGLSTDRQCYEY